MTDQEKPMDKSILAILGGLFLGLGAGFFFFPQGVFFQTSVFAFTGCMMIGLGLGLLIAAILSNFSKNR